MTNSIIFPANITLAISQIHFLQSADFFFFFFGAYEMSDESVISFNCSACTLEKLVIPTRGEFFSVLKFIILLALFL